MLRSGTYRAIAEGHTLEVRIESISDGTWVCSGDITRGTAFIASFIASDLAVDAVAGAVTGAITFRGNAELFTGSLQVNVDDRGTGSFQLGIDMEGGHRDVVAGRIDWQGAFLRRLFIEIDGLPGTQPPRAYTTRTNHEITIERAFEQVGFDVDVVVDSFPPASQGSRTRGYTLAEIHTAMERLRGDVPADRLHAHVFVCSYLMGRGNRGVLGIMYDFGAADLNRRPREGVAIFYDHPLLSDPRVPQAARDREYLFTVIHEVGHALNLLHSFDKARPSALSWMNYPHLYPRGYETLPGYDGTAEFWRQFDETFDAEELRHLRHASPREIMAGGFTFGTYEEGASVPFGGTASPRRTALGANPLRTAHDVRLTLNPVKTEYDLGEPVFFDTTIRNTGLDPIRVPDALDPSEGYLRLLVRHPSGLVRRYRPPVRLCKQAQRQYLRMGEAINFPALPLIVGADGPTFTEPGQYLVIGQFGGIDGARIVQSNPASVRIRVPNRATEKVAEALWTRPAVLQSLYLRHPLVNPEAWSEFEEKVAQYKLPEDNTTASYLNYVAGLGWMQPFDTGVGRAYHADKAGAERRFRLVKREGLPRSTGNRVEESLKNLVPARRTRAVVLHAKRGQRSPWVALDDDRPHAESTADDNLHLMTPDDRSRSEIPPSGLFGSLGLADAPAAALDPWARVVPSLRGTSTFADVVSWNIEHLHGKHQKVPRVAELIRDMRCDFWGLQEVDAESLKLLIEAINSTGSIRYGYLAVEGSGQQSGCLYRTDTTRVRRLDVPKKIFGKSLNVTMADGTTARKKVFLRDPLLCEVSVRQASGRSFDFRCAIVHLKTTDTKVKDKGNRWRAASARDLAAWIADDQSTGNERDYLIMGDMNAETANQGLGPLSKDHRLLSVGMREKYGKDQALTRVASKRLLDHIVITSDAVAHTAKQDIKEQLIIRTDAKIADWTTGLSDHVPVAVRFVLGEDQD